MIMVSTRRNYEFRIHKGYGSPAVIENTYYLSDREYEAKRKLWSKFTEQLGFEYTFIAAKL
jgi:hypothetical protein